MTLILASTSAARRAMLTAAGIDHDAVSPRVDEAAAKAALGSLDGRSMADALAELKALKVSRSYPDAVVLGCDQTLELDDGSLLDKPGDQLAAQLARLSGRTHYLHAGIVAARGGNAQWRHVGRAKMVVRPLSPAFIADYVAREHDRVAGCVGGYQIEQRGIQLFSKIDGDLFTIQGLPLLPLLDWLRINGRLAS